MLNAPHPAAFLRELRTPAQLARSWYAFAFQVPVLPELADSLWQLRDTASGFQRDSTRPDAFTADDIQQYCDAIAVPGARTATINYYRAIMHRNPRRIAPETARSVSAPTLLIWGMGDRYLGPALTERLEQWVPNLRVARIMDASHWVQHDTPGRVTALIRDFLPAHAP